MTDSTHRKDAPLNIPFRTLGGKQVWRDDYVYAGWRIQTNILTNHSRLLDVDNVRQAWGSFDQCKQMFLSIRRVQDIEPIGSHLVLMVHGIVRSAGTFGEMGRALRNAGFDAVAVSYPSTRDTIQAHAESLIDLLVRLETTETVSFVTHSMGGLILRYMLAKRDEWLRHRVLGRCVLIAPPNQGSVVARFLKDVSLYQAVYGDAGQQLTPEEVSRLPPIKGVPFGIIAGGDGTTRGYNPLLPGDNDGVVTIEETRLPGASDEAVVSDIHTVICDNPSVIEMTENFLKTGAFK